MKVEKLRLITTYDLGPVQNGVSVIYMYLSIKKLMYYKFKLKLLKYYNYQLKRSFHAKYLTST